MSCEELQARPLSRNKRIWAFKMCSPGLEIRSPSIFCERLELKTEFILITREMSFIFSLTVTTDRISS